MAENVMIDAANEKLEMISRLLEGKNQIAGNEKADSSL